MVGDKTALATPEQQICNASSSSGGVLVNGNIDKSIATWDFNAWELQAGEEHKIAAWLLKRKLHTREALETQKLSRFAQEVCSQYLPNPYHNVRHGVDVLHGLWRLGEIMPWDRLYNLHEQFAFLVAAISHDMGHFGLNNAFLVDMRDELAVRYNDVSPLENMHCAKLFLVLGDDKTNVFSHLQKDDYQCVRKLVINVILNTDIACHGPMMKDLVKLYDNNVQVFQRQMGDTNEEMWELMRLIENKGLIGRTLLHAADLSNPCKPFKITLKWAQVVVEEFFEQGDQEKAHGLPIGMLNDRTKVTLPHSQLGFIQFLVAPFVAIYGNVINPWRVMGSFLAYNVAEWADRHLQETGKDERSRAQAVCDQLEPPVIEEPAPEETAAIEDSPANVRPSMSGSQASTEAGSGSDFLDKSIVESKRALQTSKRHAVCREVRRWREHEVSATKEEQHRELVLLMLMADDNMLASRGEDFVMKFNACNSHFREPDDPSFMHVADASFDKAPPCPNTMTVAVAPDIMHSRLNRRKFDSLLTALLEKEVKY